MVHIRVNVVAEADPANPAAQAWFGQLQRLLTHAPEGVDVRSRLPVAEDRFVVLTDVVEFLQGKVDEKRLWQNSRAVWYWLQEHHHSRLVLVCMICQLPADAEGEGCRCDDRWCGKRGVWAYAFRQSPDLYNGQDEWAIGLRGLLELARNPQDIQGRYLNGNTQKRIRWFLQHLSETYPRAAL